MVLVFPELLLGTLALRDIHEGYGKLVGLGTVGDALVIAVYRGHVLIEGTRLSRIADSPGRAFPVLVKPREHRHGILPDHRFTL
jgi:hypothetical protein